MRRLVTFVFLLVFTVPFGISISGCGSKTSVVFCNGGDSGPTTGTLTSITLTPRIYGVSLNFAQKGQTAAPAGSDCNGASVSPTGLLYSTTDMTVADVNPTTGALCGGNWNRNTGGGVADYTVCTSSGKQATAQITASAQGVTSNPLPVFVHSQVTSVALGAQSQDCSLDPATNCSPASASSGSTSTTCTVLPNGCCSAPVVTTNFSSNSCLSQGATGQLAARIFDGNGNNLSCVVGHLSYAPQTTSIVTINQDGVATAVAPGSTIITASIANAGSSAGFFSTCPPKSITLNAPGVTTGNVVQVNQNTGQPLTATVVDTNNVSITGLTLQLLSTTPTTLPSGSVGAVTPIFPGTGAVSAQCVPPTCNPSPLNEIGLNGNGLPVISNNVVITTPGANSTVLYIGSTNSQYIVPIDFTTGTLGAPVRLPYVPNSMIISVDGSSIYLGNATELMVFNAISNTLTRQDTTVPGTVLAVSPDGTTLVIADTARQLVYLATAGGGIQSVYGGVATRAQFTPDSGTVYISAGAQTLVHSSFTGWTSIPAATPTTDVAVTVPSVGAFFAGAVTTARGYCPVTAVATTTSGQPTVTNTFYPDAGVAAPTTTRLAATNDGDHILGGSVVSGVATLTDLFLSNTVGGTTSPGLGARSCVQTPGPLTFSANPVAALPLAGVTATSINAILPTSDSSIAFVAYTGTGGLLPTYTPSPTGAGTLGSIPLATIPGDAAPVAPVSGVFSSDNTTFYAGTSGDNVVHVINRTTLADQPAQVISPKLPAQDGTVATPDLLVQRPRKATS